MRGNRHPREPLNFIKRSNRNDEIILPPKMAASGRLEVPKDGLERLEGREQTASRNHLSVHKHRRYHILILP